MATFKIAHLITSNHEKGYVANLGDGAGETYMGITRNNYPTWPGWKIIDEYKRKAGGSIKRYTTFKTLDPYVEQFYKTNFWDALIKGDAIASQQQANFLYDFAVNAQYNAVKQTNQALKRVKPKLQAANTSLTVDALGVMNNDPVKTYSEMFKQREAYYRELAKNPKYKPFLKEWLNRLYSFPTFINWNPQAATGTGVDMQTVARLAMFAASAIN